MANKLLVITEIKHPEHVTKGRDPWSPKFWHQLPQNKTQADHAIRAAWYNIDLESWDPGLLDVASAVDQLIGVDTYQIEFKVPSPRPVVMFDYDHPEYLKRLEYCKEVGITISITEVPVDGRWIKVP
jgi:hypothetical protein